MSALPVHPHPAIAPQRHDWVRVRDAAPLLGLSEGQLRRRCQNEYAPRGLARQAPDEQGGACREVWWISAATNPRILRRAVEADAEGRSQVLELLRSTPRPKIEEAARRAELVREFRAWRTRSGVVVREQYAAFQAAMTERHGFCPPLRTLQVWDAKAAGSADGEGMVAALVDTRGRPRGGGGVPAVDDEAWAHFCGLYLTPRRWTLSKCHRLTRSKAEEEGWRWCSESRCRQLVAERISEGDLTLAREGENAWRKRHMAPLEQDPDAWRAGECWEGDHSQLDFFARVVKGSGWVAARPWLTLWYDRRSRMIVGWHVSTSPDSITIRLALLDALEREGIGRPDVVWIDNGKDYQARAIAGLTKTERRRKADRADEERQAASLLGVLGIRAHFARPYNHNAKARIERRFGFVHTDFDREFESWVGSQADLVDRREWRERNADVLALPTIEQVRERLATWIDWYNNRADHRIDALFDPEVGRRLSPAEFYRRHAGSLAKVSTDALKLLRPVWERPMAVTKRGVGLRIGGRVLRYGAGMAQLERFVESGERVLVAWDERDVSSVDVYTSDFVYVCSAPLNRMYGGAGISKRDVQAGLAAQREQKRLAKRRIDLARLTAEAPELAAMAAREREVGEARARLAELDGHDDGSHLPSLRLVSTPLDGQADQVERERLAKAAGAEHLSEEWDPDVDLGQVEWRGRDDNDDEPLRLADFDDEDDWLADAEPADDEGTDGPDDLDDDDFDVFAELEPAP